MLFIPSPLAILAGRSYTSVLANSMTFSCSNNRRGRSSIGARLISSVSPSALIDFPFRLLNPSALILILNDCYRKICRGTNSELISLFKCNNP